MRLMITITATDQRGDLDTSQIESTIKALVASITGQDPVIRVNDMNGTTSLDAALILDRMRKRPY